MVYQKCPICLGGGTVDQGLYISQYAREHGYSSSNINDVICKTCNGIGVIKE